MKHIKILLLLAVALPFFASCSEDETNVNTGECTVGFENATVSLDEAGGLVQIPITVNGRRNGPVRLVLETAPVGDDGAVEGTHYVITDKTLNLNTDTLSTSTINVEVKPLDDTEMNANRPFTITIVSAEGAEVTANQTTVTIYNNDGYYKSLFGDWTLLAVAYDVQGNYLVNPTQLMRDVTLSGTENESDPAYESVLTATVNDLLGDGEDRTFEFEYSFSALNRTGQIGWYLPGMSGEPVKINGSTPIYMIPCLPDGLYVSGSLPAKWSLGSNDEPATEIVFDSGCAIYLTGINMSTGQLEGLEKVYEIIGLVRN